MFFVPFVTGPVPASPMDDAGVRDVLLPRVSALGFALALGEKARLSLHVADR